MGGENVFAQFRENKYGTFNLGFQEVYATVLENLFRNPESQSTGSIFLFKECVLFVTIFLIRTVVTILVKQVKMVHRY